MRRTHNHTEVGNGLSAMVLLQIPPDSGAHLFLFFSIGPRFSLMQVNTLSVFGGDTINISLNNFDSEIKMGNKL